MQKVTPPPSPIKPSKNSGFTLIELSIVLVIIGLIIGGILVGRDLIKASEIRAQISQIDKYNSAVNTFYGKYGGLPGDLNATLAAKFGFTSRYGITGRGDGDGILEGYCYATSAYYGWGQSGETLLFWVDLSKAGYIDGSFTAATDAAPLVLSSATGFSAYLPAAQIGYGNYVYVYSNGCWDCPPVGFNYYGIAFPVSLNSVQNFVSQPGMSVLQAYAIDKKMDDGLPVSGIAQVDYLGSAGISVYSPSAAADSATTCWNTSTFTYSLSASANGGTGLNCAMSFQMISPGR